MFARSSKSTPAQPVVALFPEVGGIPHISTNEAYTSAFNLLTDMRNKRGEIQSRLDDLSRGIASWSAPAAMNSVEAILADLPMGQDLQAMQSDHLDLRRRLDLLDEAIRVQERKVDAAAYEAGVAVSVTVLDQHKGIASRALKAWEELCAALVEELELFEDLGKAGYEGGIKLDRIAHPHFGDPRDKQGNPMVFYWERDIRRYTGN